MKSRYREPRALPADPQLIARYLQIAADDQAEKDQRRQSVAALIELYRLELVAVKAGRVSAVDHRLVLFVRENLRRCASEPDPLSAVESFLTSGQRGQGRPMQRHRDFVIAVEVAEKIAENMRVEDAARDVAAEIYLSEGRVRKISEDRVRKIYLEQRRADRRALEVEQSLRIADVAARALGVELSFEQADAAATESEQDRK
jgi:hypothetical protein